MNPAPSVPSASAVPERPILPWPGRPSFLVILLSAKIVLSLFILFAALTIDDLANLRSMSTLSVWDLGRAIEKSPLNIWRQALGLAAMVRIFVSVGLFVEIVRWLHTMHRNLGAFGVTPRFDSRWAILGFLVPGLNLVRPYQIAQELWGRSSPEERPGEDSSHLERSLGILVTWGAWLITGALWTTLFTMSVAVLFPSSFAASVALSFVPTQDFFRAYQMMSAVACSLTLLVIQDVQVRQQMRWQRITTRPPARPSRELGPHHGIQVALLGLFGSAVLGWAVGQASLTSELALLLSTQVALLLATLLIVLRQDWSWPQERGGWSPARALAGSALAGAGLSLAWSSLLLHVLPPAVEGSGWTPRPGALEGLGLLAVVLLIAPVMEEFVFRGAILQSFRKEWSRGPAILLSSFLFACFHLHPATMMATFFLGCLCATVRLAAGSLVPAAVLHAVYNLGTIVLLAGPRPEEVVTAELAWRGVVWVGLGLLLASSTRAAEAGSRTVRAVARAAAAGAVALAVLRGWNGGDPEWNLVTILDGACWLALAVGVVRLSRGAAVLLVLCQLATGELSALDVTATVLFVTAAVLLVAVRPPPAADGAVGVADPRWWWGEWATSLASSLGRAGEQLPWPTADAVDRGVGQAHAATKLLEQKTRQGIHAATKLLELKTRQGAKFLEQKTRQGAKLLQRTTRQGLETVRQDIETGALPQRLLKVLLPLHLVAFAWGLVLSARLLDQRTLGNLNREMLRMEQQLRLIDLVTFFSLFLLFAAWLAWIGQARETLRSLDLFGLDEEPVWRYRGLVVPRSFFSRPRALLTEVWMASQYRTDSLAAPVKSSNLRALVGTSWLVLAISLPVQLLVGSFGLVFLAHFLYAIRLSPLGMVLWILLLIRLFFLVRGIDKGLARQYKPSRQSGPS